MIKDFILNFIAVGLPIVVMQLFILPAVNSIVGSEAYGLIVSMIALINTVPVAIGNSLCNTRQLLEGTYRKQGLLGDFNLLLIVFSVAGSLVTLCVSLSYGYGLLDTLLICLSGVFMLLFNYLVVEYRLTLNFQGVVIANAVATVGTVVGAILFFAVGIWQLILIIGYLFGSLYISVRTKVLEGGLRKTPLWKKTCKLEITLLFSLVFLGLVNYGDRLILLPLQGSSAVSIYYIASLVGKLLVTVIAPMSTVILSYAARSEKLSRRKTIGLLCVSLTIGIIFWIVTIIFAPYVIEFLYPNEAVEAVKYVPIVTAVAVIQSLCSVLNPTLLRFYSAKWQIVSNALAFTMLSVLGTVLSSSLGLIGFCMGCFIAMLFKLALILFLILAAKSTALYETLNTTGEL